VALAFETHVYQVIPVVSYLKGLTTIPNGFLSAEIACQQELVCAIWKF
jgi:hypothetical protein